MLFALDNFIVQNQFKYFTNLIQIMQYCEINNSENIIVNGFYQNKSSDNICAANILSSDAFILCHRLFIIVRINTSKYIFHIYCTLFKYERFSIKPYCLYQFSFIQVSQNGLKLVRVSRLKNFNSKIYIIEQQCRFLVLSFK